MYLQLLPNQGPQPIPILVKSIVLSSENLELKVDEGETIIATVEPTDATNKQLEWSSDAPSIASVTVDESTSSATIKGVSVGETTVKAVALDGSGKFAECNVVVKPDVEPFPANANEYVDSVYDTLKVYGTAYNNYYFSLTNNNGDELQITYDDYTYSGGTYYGNYTIKNITLGTEEVKACSSSSTYTYGSLFDKSFFRLSSSPYKRDKTNNFSITYNTDKTTAYRDQYPALITRNVGTTRYRMDQEFGTGKSPQRTINYKTFNSSNSNNYCIYVISGSGAIVRDANGSLTDYKYEKNPCILKINRVLNGEITHIDYYYFYYITGEDGFIAKLQSDDGNYVYINKAGNFISEEHGESFFTGTTPIEYTFDVT